MHIPTKPRQFYGWTFIYLDGQWQTSDCPIKEVTEQRFKTQWEINLYFRRNSKHRKFNYNRNLNK